MINTPQRLSTDDLKIPLNNAKNLASADSEPSLSLAIDHLLRLSDTLELPVNSTTTALLIFHQAFQYFSFIKTDIDIYLLIITSVQIATKSTESHRKTRDIITSLYYVLYKQVMQIDEEYWRIRESVGKLEFMVLRVLRFDLSLPLAYPFVLRICNTMLEKSPSLNPLLQISFNLVNDCYFFGMGTQFSPRVIACGCIYVAIRMMDMNLPMEFFKWVAFWVGEKYNLQNPEEGKVKETSDFVKLLLKFYKKQGN